MRILVTGATGFIGSALVSELISLGYNVVCLYRNRIKTGNFPDEEVEFAKGDILDPGSLKKATKGCNRLFHLAAFTGIYARNSENIRQVNVEGTRNVLDAALDEGVKDIVFTSTAGVTGPSSGEPVNEETARKIGFFIPYEQTKAEAEAIVPGYVEKGLNIRIVNPTRLYGPGELNAGNSVTRIVKMYLEGTWRFVVGDGNSTGNYVFIDDVVRGHLLAMEKGRPGEKYLLGGEDISYNNFFRLLEEVTGVRNRLYHIPFCVSMAVAELAVAQARITGKEPFITPGHVRRYCYDWKVSSAKAEKELGYNITPLREGIKMTVEWLIQKKLLSKKSFLVF